jgi:hypothetical protein
MAPGRGEQRHVIVRGGIGDPELDDGALATVVPGRNSAGMGFEPASFRL